MKSATRPPWSSVSGRRLHGVVHRVNLLAEELQDGGPGSRVRVEQRQEGLPFHEADARGGDGDGGSIVRPPGYDLADAEDLAGAGTPDGARHPARKRTDQIDPAPGAQVDAAGRIVSAEQ